MTARASSTLSQPLMVDFRRLSPPEARRCVRALIDSGASERRAAALLAWSLADVRRAMAEALL